MVALELPANLEEQGAELDDDEIDLLLETAGEEGEVCENDGFNRFYVSRRFTVPPMPTASGL